MPRGKKSDQIEKGRSVDTPGTIPYLLRSSKPENSQLHFGLGEISSQAAKKACNMASSKTATSTTSDCTFGDVKQLILEMDKKINEKLDTITDRLESRITKVETEIPLMQESIESVHRDIADINYKKIPEIEKRLENKIKELEDQLNFQEYRSRKYNVLIYGIPETSHECTEKVVRRFFVERLKIDAQVVAKIIIANTHRLPVRENPPPENQSDPPEETTRKRPPPPPTIIVKFVCFAHRELVYSSATYQKLKDSGCSVRTDLPTALKQIRYELAKLAYTLRQEQKLQTRIRERPTKVWLEVRKNQTEPWVPY